MHNSKTKSRVNSLNNSRSKKAARPSEKKTLNITNGFLKHIWETYFLYRRATSNEDRIDHFNRMVETIQEQYKKRTEVGNNEKQTDHLRQIQQKAKLSQEGFMKTIKQKNSTISRLQAHNQILKNQLSEIKQAKSKCQEKVIQLSNKMYHTQRGVNNSFQDGFNTLDDYSAISIDREEIQSCDLRPSFFKKESFKLQFSELNQSFEYNQPQKKESSNQNFDVYKRSKHPLKQSLQIFPSDEKNQQKVNLLQQIKKIKLQTERFMQIQNERQKQKQNKRRMFTSFIEKPHPPENNPTQQEPARRFKRIRG